MMGSTITDMVGTRYGWRLRLGVLLPSVNTVAEPEIGSMLPAGVSFHTTRLTLTGGTPKELLGMTDKVEEGATLLADADVDLVVFHCTGVSMFDPTMDGKLKQRIKQATGKPATATSEAVVSALRGLGADRVVMVTPYVKAINQREMAFLAHHHITVVREQGLAIESGRGMAAVEPGEWYRLVMANRDPTADAYFISCTNIRTAPVIAALECDLGKPVVTSNQAMVWNSLRLSGINDRLPGCGRLFA